MEDVISGIRETFLDDGVDEQVLQELRHLWESKLLASKAVEQTPEPDHSTPPIIVHSSKANGENSSKSFKSIIVPKIKHDFLILGAIKKNPNIEQQSSTNSQATTAARANSSTNVSNQQSASNNPVATSIVNLDPNSKVPVQVLIVR